MMKMHLFVKKLADIRKNILSADVPMRTATIEPQVELPTVVKIQELIKSIERTIGKRDDNEMDNRFKSLKRRMNEIDADMNDKTIPIRRIFPSGDFQTEKKHSWERYRNASGQTTPSKEILIGDNSLWEYLIKADQFLHRQLYHEVIKNFKVELDHYNAVTDYDVSEFVRRNPREAANFASRAISFLLPIRRNKTLRTSQNIPRVVVGSDRKVILEVIQALQQENFNEFKNDNDYIKEIKELRNIMVFYIEQGNFNPVEDLAYAEKVKEIDQGHYRDLVGMTKERWYSFRNPYLPRKKVQALMNLSNDQ